MEGKEIHNYLYGLKDNYWTSSTRISLVAQKVKHLCLQCERPGFHPWVGKILWRRKWQPTPVLLPGKSHGQRSTVGYSPRGLKESDTTERLHLQRVKTTVLADELPGNGDDKAMF